jgi:hypothetical protein
MSRIRSGLMNRYGHSGPSQSHAQSEPCETASDDVNRSRLPCPGINVLAR